jgi:hypothetical protein
VTPFSKVSRGGKGPEPILNSLKKLEQQMAYVGIPESRGARKGEVVHHIDLSGKKTKFTRPAPINNAQLLYIHTNGSPIRGIPARPVIEPAILAPDNKASISEELKQAAKAALDGKPQAMKQFLKRAGLDAQNRVRKWFVDPRNHWAPNAPSTIRRKGSDKPLIDTGQLRAAITYVVTE